MTGPVGSPWHKAPWCMSRFLCALLFAPFAPLRETCSARNLLRESFEERIVLPLRARRTVGHLLQQAHDNPVELRRRSLIHRLIQIVGRLVIAVAHPIVEDFIF